MRKSLTTHSTIAIACISINSYGGQVISNGADIQINTDGGLKVATRDKESKFQLGGRLMWDYDNFNHSNIGGTEGSESELRRGRIYVKGTIRTNWSYKLQFEFKSIENTDGGNSVDLEDAYIVYSGLPVQLKFGRFHRPVGLEELTSSKNTSTIERAAFWDIVPSSRSDYNFQIGQYKTDYTWAIGIYENEDSNEEGIKDSNGNLTYSYGGRATYLPTNTDASKIHIGISYLHRDFDNNLQRAYLRTRLATHTADKIALADAGTTGKKSNQIGLEVAWVSGSFSLQSEYMRYKITTDNTVANDVEFYGYYLQATHSLTGESRVYQQGSFDKIKPSSFGGAWELVLKYEHGHADYLTTSKYDLTTLGVNWYINSNVRASLNYLTGETDNTGKNDNFDAISTRLQLTF